MKGGKHARAARWDDPSKHWPRLRWLVLVAVCSLAGGVLIGRGLAGPESPRPPIAVIEPQQPPDSCEIRPLAPRWEAGVPLSWPQTRTGAVAAAAGYAKVLSALWFLTDPQRRSQALERMAAPTALGQLRATQETIAGGIANSPLGMGLGRRDVESMLRTILLGYQVQSYTPTQAQIALWSVVIYGNDGGLAPQALYAISTLRLRWIADWKLVDVSTVPGPVPLQGQATPSAAEELIHASQTFKEFGDAPES
jgi:hypothetical protein